MELKEAISQPKGVIISTCAITKKTKEEEKLKNIDISFANNKISPENYNRIIDGIQSEIRKIDDEIFRLTSLNEKKVDIKFDYAVNLLSNIEEILTTAPLKDKINILGSIFPEKIEFDGKNYRTNSFNKVLDVIFQDTSQLYDKKKEEPDKKSSSSSFVPLTNLFSEPFMNDLELIWKLRKTLQTNHF